MEFTIDKEREPDDSILRTLLEAHMKYERTNNAKSVCLHLLAIVGILVWFEAMWPAIIPGPMETFVLTVWGALLALSRGPASRHGHGTEKSRAIFASIRQCRDPDLDSRWNPS